MIKTLVATVIVTATIAGAGPLAAQEGPPSADNGRYQLLEGAAPGGAAGSATLMVDSQTGRVWILDTDPAIGPFMRRIPLKRLDQAPEGMLTRPLPITRTPAPAK